jgi:RimJ/RimL family protein N-acetyltransferase
MTLPPPSLKYTDNPGLSKDVLSEVYCMQEEKERSKKEGYLNMPLSSDGYLLKREAYHVLADVLGESPQTVIAVHQLHRGLCRVYILGTPGQFDAVIIEIPASAELMGYGHDVNALYELLQVIPDWDCIDVAPDCAQALGQLIELRMGIRVRYYGDIHHALRKPVVPWHHPAVRQLTLRDAPLLETALEELRWTGFESTQAMLSEGLVAAALVEGHVVAIAHTSARSRDYTDIGVGTMEPWRNRGFSSAAAALVAQKIQEAGQVPVWSTGEDNYASLRVAEKLGFTREGLLTYVILQPERKGL